MQLAFVLYKYFPFGGLQRDFLRIAQGLETGPKRDMIALNAGLALWISDRAATIREGVRLALERLESGLAAERLTTLVEQHGSPDILRRAREAWHDLSRARSFTRRSRPTGPIGRGS